MLYLLPDELLVAIVEYCDQETRKSLSLVSRRLRNPSQRIILKRVYLSRHKLEILIPECATDGGKLHSEVILNDSLLFYTQTLKIFPYESSNPLEMNTVESLFTALHRMQSLRDIKLLTIPFTATMLDHLFEVLSTRLYNVQLWRCSYPADYTIQQAGLKIQRLQLQYESFDSGGPSATTKLFAAIIERSISSITSLTLSMGVGVLAYVGRMPRLTSLEIRVEVSHK
jgi:hypothetical protein